MGAHVTKALLTASEQALARGDAPCAQEFASMAARYAMYYAGGLPLTVPRERIEAPSKPKRRRKPSSKRQGKHQAPAPYDPSLYKKRRENAVLSAAIASAAIICLFVLFLHFREAHHIDSAVSNESLAPPVVHSKH